MNYDLLLSECPSYGAFILVRWNTLGKINILERCFLTVLCTYSQVLTLHFVRLIYHNFISKDITKKLREKGSERARREIQAASLSSCTDFKAGIWRIQTTKSLTNSRDSLKSVLEAIWKNLNLNIQLALTCALESHTQVHQTFFIWNKCSRAFVDSGESLCY